MLWFYFFLLVFLESIADIFAKKLGLSKSFHYGFFVTALLFYLGGNAAWLFSMRRGMELWKGVVLFCIAQAVTGVVIAVCMGESIEARQWVGVVTALVAIALMV